MKATSNATIITEIRTKDDIIQNLNIAKIALNCITKSQARDSVKKKAMAAITKIEQIDTNKGLI